MFKDFSIKTEVNKKPSKFLKIYLETSQEDNFHRNLSRGDYSSKPLWRRKLFIETSSEAKNFIETSQKANQIKNFSEGDI